MGTRTYIPTIAALSLLLASCATMQPTAGVRDDIYFMPSDAPAQAAAAPRQSRTEREQQQQAYADDYYDPGTAENYATPRSYYDMAYNDPYYYNYGRFGFGGGMGMGMMGWQSGWGGPGWGMGMGWGQPMGMGMGMGWGGMGMGGMGMGMGYGMYDPWMGGWGRPWHRPMGFHPMGFDPYMGGYGWGNYYGPYGNCFSCYSPVIVGGSSGVVVGHRPTTGRTGGQGGGTVNQPRSVTNNFRDPVGLSPVTRGDDMQPARTGGDAGRQQQRGIFQQPQQTRPGRDVGRGIDRGGSGIERGGGIGGGGGMPSRSGGGGGSRPMTSPRPR